MIFKILRVVLALPVHVLKCPVRLTNHIFRRLIFHRSQARIEATVEQDGTASIPRIKQNVLNEGAAFEYLNAKEPTSLNGREQADSMMERKSKYDLVLDENTFAPSQLWSNKAGSCVQVELCLIRGSGKRISASSAPKTFVFGIKIENSFNWLLFDDTDLLSLTARKEHVSKSKLNISETKMILKPANGAVWSASSGDYHGKNWNTKRFSTNGGETKISDWDRSSLHYFLRIFQSEWQKWLSCRPSHIFAHQYVNMSETTKLGQELISCRQEHTANSKLYPKYEQKENIILVFGKYKIFDNVDRRLGTERKITGIYCNAYVQRGHYSFYAAPKAMTSDATWTETYDFNSDIGNGTRREVLGVSDYFYVGNTNSIEGSEILRMKNESMGGKLFCKSEIILNIHVRYIFQYDENNFCDGAGPDPVLKFCELLNDGASCSKLYNANAVNYCAVPQNFGHNSIIEERNNGNCLIDYNLEPSKTFRNDHNNFASTVNGGTRSNNGIEQPGKALRATFVAVRNSGRKSVIMNGCDDEGIVHQSDFQNNFHLDQRAHSSLSKILIGKVSKIVISVIVLIATSLAASLLGQGVEQAGELIVVLLLVAD